MSVINILGRPVDGDSPYQAIEPSDVIKNADALNGSPDTKTADYSITDEDTIILADGSSNTVTITLPAPSWAGESYIIKAIDITSAVDVDTADSGTIDGSASYTFAAQWDAIKVVSDGTDWFIVAEVA